MVEGLEVSGLDVSFEVKRTLGFGSGEARCDVYNLSKQSRDGLGKLARANLQLIAGYADQQTLLFNGDLRTPLTVRRGADVVTTLEGTDCSWVYGGAKPVSIAVPSGASQQQAWDQLVKATGVKAGNAATIELPGQLPSGASFTGNPMTHLQRIAARGGYEVSVQDGAFQVLQIGKAFAGQAQVISADTGLIEAPQPQRSNRPQIRMWTVKALIRPGLLPGRAVRIETAEVTGDFRIREVTFVGSTFGDEWFANMTVEDLKYAI
jgi:hypothetical protein